MDKKDVGSLCICFDKKKLREKKNITEREREKIYSILEKNNWILNGNYLESEKRFSKEMGGNKKGHQGWIQWLINNKIGEIQIKYPLNK